MGELLGSPIAELFVAVVLASVAEEFGCFVISGILLDEDV